MLELGHCFVLFELPHAADLQCSRLQRVSPGKVFVQRLALSWECLMVSMA